MFFLYQISIMKKVALGMIFVACNSQSICNGYNTVQGNLKHTLMNADKINPHHSDTNIKNTQPIRSDKLRYRTQQKPQERLTQLNSYTSRSQKQQNYSQRVCKHNKKFPHKNTPLKDKILNQQSRKRFENNLDRYIQEMQQNGIKRAQQMKIGNNLRKEYKNYWPQMPVALEYSNGESSQKYIDSQFIDEFFKRSFHMPSWSNPASNIPSDYQKLRINSKESDQQYFKEQQRFLNLFRNHLTAEMRNHHRNKRKYQNKMEQNLQYNQKPQVKKQY